MTTPSGGVVGDATVRVTADTDPATRAINSLSQGAQNGLRTLATTGLGVATSFARIGATAGTAIPLVAGVAAAVQSIIPAATAAATGFLAIRQATAVVQLGMVGVGDAVSAAFETGEGSAEAFEEALERLSPAAASFAIAVRDMRGDFVAFQQSIQEELFTELDSVLENTATAVLPVLQENLLTTANIMGNMAAQTAGAASELAEDGTLGQAMQGANNGLRELEGIPALVVTAFGQLAAAGAPAFERLTSGVAGVAERISESLTAGFESGALQESVGTALDILRELGGVAQDAFGIVQNVFGAVSTGGEDLFGVLGTVIGVLEEVTGTEAFQEAIAALAEIMGDLASTAAPLLVEALSAIAPIVTNLAGPVQGLIENLGAALMPIIEALGPVLDVASQALGEFVSALSPIFPVIGQLIAQLGPILVPIFESLGRVAAQLAPVISQLVAVLAGILQPVLEVLPDVIEPILLAFEQLISAVLPILQELLTALGPTFDELVLVLVDLLIALEPVITGLLLLATDVLVGLTPVLIQVVGAVGSLASILSGALAFAVNNVVIPALNAVTALLTFDFARAWRSTRDTVSNAIDRVVDAVSGLPDRVYRALSRLAGRLTARMNEGMRSMLQAALNGIVTIARFIGNLPSLALGALGNIGSRLYGAGRALMAGFRDGIVSMAQSIINEVRGIVDSLTGWLPGSPAEVGPLSGSGYVYYRGQHLSEDFARGIEDRATLAGDASAELADVTSAGLAVPAGTTVASLTTPAPGGGVAVALPPAPINLTVVNQGVMGSRVEVLDWLVTALEELSRQRRLEGIA